MFLFIWAFKPPSPSARQKPELAEQSSKCNRFIIAAKVQTTSGSFAEEQFEVPPQSVRWRGSGAMPMHGSPKAH